MKTPILMAGAGIGPSGVGSRFRSMMRRDAAHLLPIGAAAAAFIVLFWESVSTLAQAWWSNPDASHGLLLGPLAVVLAWRGGLVAEPRPRPGLGTILLLGAVLLHYVSSLAAEMFTLHASLVGAIIALIVFTAGVPQLLHWWLPLALMLLSIRIPEVVLNSLSLPLQLKASALGASLLEWRDVPHALTGNVIHLPGRSLFVTEACSGLRSITALLALALLIGGIWLRTFWSRLLLVAVAIPVAMVINGVRIFVTGFATYYFSPRLGEGFMHYTEGWALFVAALVTLAGISGLVALAERRILMGRAA